MAKARTTPWDAAEHLETGEDMALYQEAALEEGDPALVAAALGDIVRAKGMSEIARETGLGRESLYKALSPEGNPECMRRGTSMQKLLCISPTNYPSFAFSSASANTPSTNGRFLFLHGR